MIYLDNAATTRIAPEVLEAMMPYLTEQFGNPGSVHRIGRTSKDAVEHARCQVAELIGAKPEQIIFTSGATEANNAVFHMVCDDLKRFGKRHIVTSAVEHKSVMKSVLNLVDCHGFDVTFAKVGAKLGAHSENIMSAIQPDTGIVSCMNVNNEVGLGFDVESIGKACNERGILFHTDCVQAVGCRSIDVKKIGCDFATISSHKIHGPKGVGALFVKAPSIWSPMIRGGDGQEFGLRGGTENVAGIVGFGAACEILSKASMELAAERMEVLKHAFLTGLNETMLKHGLSDVWRVNGVSDYGTKTINISVDRVDAQSLVLLADKFGVCISAGSACNSREDIPSHVLTAIGLTPAQARSSFRVSFSRMNTTQEASDGGTLIGECISLLLGM